jgi:uncharacterized protein YaaN involved in tellurite resistance
MGLIKFIKSLFSKAEVVEKEIETIIEEIETKEPEIAKEIKTEVEKQKNKSSRNLNRDISYLWNCGDIHGRRKSQSDTCSKCI